MSQGTPPPQQHGGPPPQGQYPPQGGQYPPQQGLQPPGGQYPPQQGLQPPGGQYPPHGGPPPGGQYPPPGGQYPPPGGQYPPPGGQYPPPQGQYPPPQQFAPPPAQCPPINGQVTIRIIEAKGLRSADRGGKSDPYAQIVFHPPGKKDKASKIKWKTRVEKKTLTPKWNESHLLNLTGITPYTLLTVTLWDWDKTGTHDSLGCVVVPIGGLVQGQEKTQWLPVGGQSAGKKKQTGELHVGLTASNFSFPPVDETLPARQAVIQAEVKVYDEHLIARKKKKAKKRKKKVSGFFKKVGKGLGKFVTVEGGGD